MRRLSQVIALTALLISPTAIADVPPPDDYEESCTVEAIQKDGETCVMCDDAYHGDRDACETKLAKDGYERRCKTWGASSWSEGWCKKGTAETPPPTKPTPPNGGGDPPVETTPPAPIEKTPPPAEKKSGCHGGSLPSLPTALAFGLMGLAMISTRRR